MFTNARKLDEVPTPIWITLGLLACLLWWPLGLLVVAWVVWRGNMFCSGFGDRHWHDRADRHGTEPPRTSGNYAFDEYRAETLKRLEEEQRSFREYLERLRQARDKAEFDQFMEDRRSRQARA